MKTIQILTAGILSLLLLQNCCKCDPDDTTHNSIRLNAFNKVNSVRFLYPNSLDTIELTIVDYGNTSYVASLESGIFDLSKSPLTIQINDSLDYLLDDFTYREQKGCCEGTYIDTTRCSFR